MCRRASWDTPDSPVTRLHMNKKKGRTDEYRALGDAEHRSRIAGSGMVYDRQLTVNDEPYTLKSYIGCL